MKYQQPRFSVPMPSGAAEWPFPAQPPADYCGTCDRPAHFCECDKGHDKKEDA